MVLIGALQYNNKSTDKLKHYNIQLNILNTLKWAFCGCLNDVEALLSPSTLPGETNALHLLTPGWPYPRLG